MRSPLRSAVFILIALVTSARIANAETAVQFRIEKDIPYRTEAETAADDYARSQCKLDLYLPTKPDKNFPLIIWFHGGGLTGGSKAGNPKAENGGDVGLLARLNANGIGVATIGYRLSPKVKYPTYLQDAARGVAWCVAEMPKRGVDPKAIFVSGHSAGGYIAAMLAMDERLLKDAGVAPDKIAGYIPVSGQMLTHYTIRIERGMKKENLFADEASPVFHVRKVAPPMLVLVGDKDMEMRLEENQLFVSAMKDAVKNQTTTLVVVPDRDHGSICNRLLMPGDKGGEELLAFIMKWKGKSAPQK